MLFECHICDRKFKKESDRDRHLYVHNVRVERLVFSCKLCKYEAYKQALIDSHYLKVLIIHFIYFSALERFVKCMYFDVTTVGVVFPIYQNIEETTLIIGAGVPDKFKSKSCTVHFRHEKGLKAAPTSYTNQGIINMNRNGNSAIFFLYVCN